ncbi:MAG TPA: PilC/PilY family type IV pilus protein [Burkholderiales bacterium]|nr:PilC/PilY family type IV pilus protein [Burkholderiales bacterium]
MSLLLRTVRHVQGSWRRVILLCAALAGAVVTGSSAEDVDLFVNGSASTAGARPNVLIIVDNSANWSAANQKWPGGLKQGEAELRALRKVIGELQDNVNVGLMFLTPGTVSNGAYVRFHVRQMTPQNKAALQELIGDENCIDGRNSLNGTPNCVLRNFDTPTEKISTAQVNYSAALFEAFKYLGGFTRPADAQTGVPGSPVSASQFGPARYSGDPDPKSDPAAYADAGKREHLPPFDATSTCAQSSIIFIGNGFPNQDAPASLLTGVGGATAQLPMPDGYGGYVAPAAKDIRYADEWAKFLYTTDVDAAPGQQSVSVYTIDVYNAQPDARQNRLLMSMAKHGGGRYFPATDELRLESALRQVIVDIQSANSVFTSASLPVNATNRSQAENQVYIGMFRPDRDGWPRWYGNLKRYQVGLVNGEPRLTDKDGAEAIAASTGYIQSCATSFWTTDSGDYWNFSPLSAAACLTSRLSAFSDAPDGPMVEKGAAAEVLRRGNDPQAPSYTVNRTLYTCPSAASCTALAAFNAITVPAAAVGAANATEHQRIIDYTLGRDVNDDNGNGNVSETRASLHGDVVHSRPLPINYGSPAGVVLYYGANDGSFRAVAGDTGRELWAFVAPEHHRKLKRLADNTPAIDYPGMPPGITPAPARKDYFFDGTAGIYQSRDNSRVWIFPTMRRGGRTVYAFDVSNPASPALMWRAGCPNTADDTGCTAGYEGIGQTWSTPSLARVSGYDQGSSPVVVMGGGYDACEDADTPSPACGDAKGRRVFVIDARTGALLASFATLRSVAADIALVDRNFDGLVDHAYAADTGGNLYRVDFSDPKTLAALASPSWKITHIAATQGAGRKFLWAPAVAAVRDRVYLALGSGDRERPLIGNYPYAQDVKNRFYMHIDTFADGAPVDLDGSAMANFTAGSTCSATLPPEQRGWYIDLDSGRGEQTVTSALIYGGVVYFSTHRPVAATPGACGVNLGVARGYAVNLLNASGAVGTQTACGAQRSAVFTGGGLPPTPVAGTVPIDGKPVSVLVGAIQRSGGASSAIGVQRAAPAITPKRTRIYWFVHGKN